VRELNEGDTRLDLQIRIAVNTGEALVSLGARPSMGESMVAGDVVNTASRLQSAAPYQRDRRRRGDLCVHARRDRLRVDAAGRGEG
jgi:class 3 adenylate cyclase